MNALFHCLCVQENESAEEQEARLEAYARELEEKAKAQKAAAQEGAAAEAAAGEGEAGAAAAAPMSVDGQ